MDYAGMLGSAATIDNCFGKSLFHLDFELIPKAGSDGGCPSGHTARETKPAAEQVLYNLCGFHKECSIK